jgi:hypothetical protein
MITLLVTLLLACTPDAPTQAPPQAPPEAVPTATQPPPPEPSPPPGPARCGGIAGLPCAEGTTCVDDPSDACDPAQGGADCMGVCQPAAPRPDDCRAPELYLGDKEQCMRMRFTCDEGKHPFFDACGCGCALDGSD